MACFRCLDLLAQCQACRVLDNGMVRNHRTPDYDPRTDRANREVMNSLKNR
ncbi:MAG: hypothetical protein BWX48_02049 [Verrucomicrobia bacterium ADurb.Bin006]|nr:MAG: hypothetical protein BWX48_02049 [Verrucomicrobia bacterium ADurb.Bin006]